MKLATIQEIEAFKDVLNEAEGSVWTEDMSGHRYDLKNAMEQYIAIGEMLKDPDNDLELFASDKNTERQLLGFFNRFDHRAA